MSESSKDKTKQTTMGTFFTTQTKTKEMSDKEKEERNRFKNSSKKDGDWTSDWSTGWNSWSFTDWKKKDTEDYRNGYPGKKDKPSQSDNLKFYKNELKSYPDGDFIDTIHKKWWGNYKLLERHHGYIQWLFPIRESGMNFHAQELQLHEAQKIMEDQKAQKRVLKSYMMMLDFYGMKIKDKVTGEIEKAENWKERFQHLNRSYHNYLRITRILKCLGELGYERIKVKFLEFVIEEALEKKTLKNCYKSCKDYWVETLRDDGERKYIQDYMQKVEEGYVSDEDAADTYKSYSGHSDEVEMVEESQEMKHYAEETEKDSEEEIPKLENQMVVDGTLQGEDSIATDTEKDSEEEIPKLENQMSVDGTLQGENSIATDTEMAPHQDSNEINSGTHSETVKTENIESTGTISQTNNSQDTQSCNLEQI